MLFSGHREKFSFWSFFDAQGGGYELHFQFEIAVTVGNICCYCQK